MKKIVFLMLAVVVLFSCKEEDGPAAIGIPIKKVKIIDATADSEQPGETIELSYDGDTETFYHANWGDSRKEGFFELIYYVEGAPTLVSMEYTPRPGSTNGTFGKISVYASTVDNKDNFTKVMDYDCAKPAGALAIEFPSPAVNTYAVKIIVDGATSVSGFASCAEMIFFENVTL